MLRQHLFQIVRRYLSLALGAVFGLVMCTLLMFWLSALQVHQVLTEHAQNRAYVSLDCMHCQKALAAIAQYPGDNAIVVIPIDVVETPERDRLCAAAIRAIRDGGGLRLRLLSEANLCRRLVREARAWLEAGDSGPWVEAQGSGRPMEVPTWVVGGQRLSPGWSEENIAVLQREGVLSRDLEIP